MSFGNPYYGRRPPSFLQSMLQGLIGGANTYGQTRIATQDRQRQQQAQDDERTFQQQIRPLQIQREQAGLQNEQQMQPIQLQSAQIGLQNNQLALKRAQDLANGIDPEGDRARQQALRNLLVGKMAGDADQYENPAPIFGAVGQLTDPKVKIGQATQPGFDYRPGDGSAPPPTVAGFPTHVPPMVPPNTVDLQDVYRQAGRTKAELQQQSTTKQVEERAAAAQKLEELRQRGRVDLETLRANPKMARTEAEYRAKISKAYSDQGGSPEYRGAFIDSEVQKWRDAAAPAMPTNSGAQAGFIGDDPELGIFGSAPPAASPGTAGAAGPTAAQMFPNGTAAQAKIAKDQAQTTLLQKKPAEIQAHIDLMKQQGQHLSDADQIALWRAKVDEIYKSGQLDQGGARIAQQAYATSVRGALGPRSAADPRQTELMKNLNTQIRQVGGSILRMNEGAAKATDPQIAARLRSEAQGLSGNFLDLVHQRDAIAQEQPVGAPQGGPAGAPPTYAPKSRQFPGAPTLGGGAPRQGAPTPNASGRVYSLGKPLDYQGQGGIFNRDLFQAVRGLVKSGQTQEIYKQFGDQRSSADAYIAEAKRSLGVR